MTEAPTVGNRLSRGCGVALLFAGILAIAINSIVSPLMLAHPSPPEVVPTTNIYLLRQSLSGISALLLIFGCLGIHLIQRIAAGRFGAIAFVIAFVGGSLLFAVEFTDVFVLPAVARANPETFLAIDKNIFMSIGFGSAAGLFALGWILLSISAWRTRVLHRWAAITTLSGLFLIPLLQAPLGFPGAIAGNVVFGLGLIGLGLGVIKHPTADL